MAGRVVVEGAAYSRGLLVEAYVPASSLTCRLHVSVEDLKRLFIDDPEKLFVGRKGEMVQEFVKMLYFQYTLETEEADSASPDGVRLRQHHYSDREPWSCLEQLRDGDYDVHWELRDPTTSNNKGSASPTRSMGPNKRHSGSSSSSSSSSACTGLVRVELEGGGGGSRGVRESSAAGLAAAEEVGSKKSLFNSSSACSGLTRAVPDERAVWVLQRLCVSGTLNLFDVAAADDMEADAGAGAGVGVHAKGGRVTTRGVAASTARIVRSRNENLAQDGTTTTTTTTSASSRPQSMLPFTSPKKSRGKRNRLVKGVVEGGGVTGEGTKQGAKVRVNAFSVRVEEYKEELRQVEATKAAKLQAWLAIKIRFRGLTLGTVIRVSGRLLSLMVYELPQQPGNLRMFFTNAPTGDTFSITVGVGVLAETHGALATNTTPRSWTLGQRRRIVKCAIAERSFLVPVEDDDSDDERQPIGKL
ncbi:unnamed protein product [Laminaria digitata]